MRIALLSTSQTGGAGLAAIRYSQALSSIGIRNDLYALPSSKERERTEVKDISRTLFEKMQSKALTVLQQRLIQKGNNLLTPLSLEPRDIERITSNYDLVHLHSTYNILNNDGFESLIESDKRIVVTLHDQRWFTGGCHYSGLCEGYKHECSRCPEATIIGKSIVQYSAKNHWKDLSSYSNLKFISPSFWLANQASESKNLSGTSINVIRNPIPSHDSTVGNTQVKLAKNELTKIVFVSDNLQNPLKGLDLLIEAFNLMNFAERANFSLLLIGKNPPNISNFPVMTTAISITKTEDLCAELQFQDLLVVPSRQDNLPNVIGEAYSSGAKVLGSSVGGIPEVINSNTGMVFENGNAQDLATKLLSFDKRYLRDTVLDYFFETFSYRNVARQINHVYED